MRLYYNRFTRATRVRWLVEELGIPCEIVPVDMRAGEHKRPEYMALHPLGKLPAFVDDDGTVMIESAAIVLHLADKHSAGNLAPPLGTSERAQYLTWILYGMQSLEGPVEDWFYAMVLAPEAERDPVRGEKAKAAFRAVAAPLEARLEGREWLLDTGFSAADIVVGAILVWAERMGMCEGLPNVQAYSARCGQRPGFKAGRS